MFTRADKILVIVLIVLSAASYPAIRHFFPGGTFITVEVAGEEVSTVRLGLSKEITVWGKIGESTIRFDERGARFVKSPCSDKKCIEAGYVRDAGDEIRCEENDVTIRVIGNGGWGLRSGVDFITR